MYTDSPAVCLCSEPLVEIYAHNSPDPCGESADILSDICICRYQHPYLHPCRNYRFSGYRDRYLYRDDRPLCPFPRQEGFPFSGRCSGDDDCSPADGSASAGEREGKPEGLHLGHFA